MTNAQRAIQNACNRLALAPTRTCRAVPASGVPTKCCFCALPINVGDLYRDKGSMLRSHDFCFKAVVMDAAQRDAKHKHDYRDGDLCSVCDKLKPVSPK
jgi:hypothetical protein